MKNLGRQIMTALAATSLAEALQGHLPKLGTSLTQPNLVLNMNEVNKQYVNRQKEITFALLQHVEQNKMYLEPPDEHGLVPGDHVYYNRSNIFTHHGVYIGFGQILDIQRKGDKCFAALSSIEDWKRVGKGGKIYKRNYREPIDKKQVFQRARAFVGKMSKYDVVSANCEHFATYLMVGNYKSAQISMLILAPTLIAGGYSAKRVRKSVRSSRAQ